MELDFTEKGKVKIGMTEYVESMLEVFPEKIKSTDTAVTPASNGLFNEGQGKKLDEERADAYHTMVAKALFYASVQDQTYSLQLLCSARGSKDQMKPTGQN
jgi:hypothetical protein